MTKFLLIPPSLMQLQRPWFPKDAYPKAERIIRFGGQVVDFGNGCAQTMEWMSGGAGTICGDAAGMQTIASFNELSKDQYHRVTDKTKSMQRLLELHDYLSSCGVSLIGDGYQKEMPGPLNHVVMADLLQIIALLPSSHLGHDHFKELRLGGWGGGAAKCSAYEDPTVLIFEFATSGPVRNLYALLLHEIGHSFAANLPGNYYEAIGKARRRIIELGASYGVDYLHGEESRKNYYLFSTEEFIAETYMMYVTQGAFSPEGLSYLGQIWEGASPGMLSRHNNFLDSIDPQARRIWGALWSLYRKCFGGTEYV
jgi:hypothetical protein